ncbi:hypothetical protein [Streptomyces hirsutus]
MPSPAASPVPKAVPDAGLLRDRVEESRRTAAPRRPVAEPEDT